MQHIGAEKTREARRDVGPPAALVPPPSPPATLEMRAREPAAL